MQKSYIKQFLIDITYKLPKFTPLGWLVIACIMIWVTGICMLLVG